MVSTRSRSARSGSNVISIDVDTSECYHDGGAKANCKRRSKSVPSASRHVPVKEQNGSSKASIASITSIASPSAASIASPSVASRSVALPAPAVASASRPSRPATKVVVKSEPLPDDDAKESPPSNLRRTPTRSAALQAKIKLESQSSMDQALDMAISDPKDSPKPNQSSELNRPDDLDEHHPDADEKSTDEDTSGESESIYIGDDVDTDSQYDQTHATKASIATRNTTASRPPQIPVDSLVGILDDASNIVVKREPASEEGIVRKRTATKYAGPKLVGMRNRNLSSRITQPQNVAAAGISAAANTLTKNTAASPDIGNSPRVAKQTTMDVSTTLEIDGASHYLAVAATSQPNATTAYDKATPSSTQVAQQADAPSKSNTSKAPMKELAATSVLDFYAILPSSNVANSHVRDVSTAESLDVSKPTATTHAGSKLVGMQNCNLPSSILKPQDVAHDKKTSVATRSKAIQIPVDSVVEMLDDDHDNIMGREPALEKEVVRKRTATKHAGSKPIRKLDHDQWSRTAQPQNVAAVGILAAMNTLTKNTAASPDIGNSPRVVKQTTMDVSSRITQPQNVAAVGISAAANTLTKNTAASPDIGNSPRVAKQTTMDVSTTLGIDVASRYLAVAATSQPNATTVYDKATPSSTQVAQQTDAPSKSNISKIPMNEIAASSFADFSAVPPSFNVANSHVRDVSTDELLDAPNLRSRTEIGVPLVTAEAEQSATELGKPLSGNAKAESSADNMVKSPVSTKNLTSRIEDHSTTASPPAETVMGPIVESKQTAEWSPRHLSMAVSDEKISVTSIFENDVHIPAADAKDELQGIENQTSDTPACTPIVTTTIQVEEGIKPKEQQRLNVGSTSDNGAVESTLPSHESPRAKKVSKKRPRSKSAEPSSTSQQDESHTPQSQYDDDVVNSNENLRSKQDKVDRIQAINEVSDANLGVDPIAEAKEPLVSPRRNARRTPTPRTMTPIAKKAKVGKASPKLNSTKKCAAKNASGGRAGKSQQNIEDKPTQVQKKNGNNAMKVDGKMPPTASNKRKYTEAQPDWIGFLNQEESFAPSGANRLVGFFSSQPVIDHGMHLGIPALRYEQRGASRSDNEFSFVSVPKESDVLLLRPSSTSIDGDNMGPQKSPSCLVPYSEQPTSLQWKIGLPNTGSCRWVRTPEKRLLGNFSKDKEVTKCDEQFLLKMMEADDFVVVTSGLISELDYETCQHLEQMPISDTFLRVTVREHASGHCIDAGRTKMEWEDYIRYLTRLEAMDGNSHLTMFTYKDTYLGVERTIDMRNMLLSIQKEDMRNKPFREMLEKFTRSHRLPGLLPGKHHCLTSAVCPSARPFTGPFFTQSPSGMSTPLKMAADGTLDTAICCIDGAIDILILKRLDDDDAAHAQSLFNDAVKNGQCGGKQSNFWHEFPDMKPEELSKFQPIRVTLTRGEIVHINKGRLFAMRCHSASKVDPELNLRLPCKLVTWQWSYRGFTVEGIHREIYMQVDTAINKNREKKLKSPAIPQLCILQLALKAIASENLTLRQGVSCCLIDTLQRHIRLWKWFEEWEEGIEKQLVFSKDNPLSDDFFCRICFVELPNAYLHCDDCETLFEHSFNICISCFQEKKHKDYQGSHLTSPTDWNTDATILEDMAEGHDHKQCQSKVGEASQPCRFCREMSCNCHDSFSLQYRFWSKQELEDRLKQIQMLHEPTGPVVAEK